MRNLKRGRASDAEIEYIRNNSGSLSDYEMAEELGRRPSFVKKIRATLPSKLDPVEQDEEILRLRASHFWGEVRKQLMGDEVTFFEQQWVRLTEQFSQHGIMTTDEMMMKDLIMHEINANRVATRKTDHLRMIDDLEARIDAEIELDIDARDVASLANWETQRAAYIAALNSLTREHLEYQKKKDEKLLQLKATRDQRLKSAEQSTSNFWEMLRQMNTPEMRKHWSRHSQRLNLAAQIVRLKWSATIQYEDGKFDKPFLSPEGELADETHDEGSGQQTN